MLNGITVISSRLCNATGKRSRFFLSAPKHTAMKQEYTLTKKFIGYGHYMLEISNSGGVKSSITGDTDLIERLNSEIEEEKEKAIEEAIAFVLKSK